MARTTATADELTVDELVAGGLRLRRKVARYKPRWLAVLGIGAYRRAFNQRAVAIGVQAQALAGARVWVLPNPSGLNASYQLPALERAFRELREAAALPARRKTRQRRIVS